MAIDMSGGGCASIVALAKAVLLSVNAVSLSKEQSSRCLGAFPFKASCRGDMECSRFGNEAVVEVHHAKEFLQ